ncbi:hypothetical protein MAR_020652 [Mya arenaria]|uniref:Uncharacterized protein n=1 Tax=Mya arenaria TaxID=6604 RepID=A0ABY7E5G8_MYAAR|nr:hypothetical protein MAR_020652 [Mya arenaria]
MQSLGFVSKYTVKSCHLARELGHTWLSFRLAASTALMESMMVRTRGRLGEGGDRVFWMVFHSWERMFEKAALFKDTETMAHQKNPLVQVGTGVSIQCLDKPHEGLVVNWEGVETKSTEVLGGSCNVSLTVKHSDVKQWHNLSVEWTSKGNALLGVKNSTGSMLISTILVNRTMEPISVKISFRGNVIEPYIDIRVCPYTLIQTNSLGVAEIVGIVLGSLAVVVAVVVALIVLLRRKKKPSCKKPEEGTGPPLKAMDREGVTACYNLNIFGVKLQRFGEYGHGRFTLENLIPVDGHLTHMDVEWVVASLAFKRSSVREVVVPLRHTLVRDGVLRINVVTEGSSNQPKRYWPPCPSCLRQSAAQYRKRSFPRPSMLTVRPEAWAPTASCIAGNTSGRPVRPSSTVV